MGPGFPEVLTAARTGAEWAWTQLHRDLAPALAGYLRAKGTPEPEDLVGEVFVQVVKGISSFEGDEGAFRSWIFTIAHRKDIDQGRYMGRRPVQAAPDEMLQQQGGSGDTEQEAMAALADSRVRQLIAALSEDQRDVVFLRILGGLTVDEVAAVVGKSSTAVKALQRRGLAQIKKAILRQGVSV